MNCVYQNSDISFEYPDDWDVDETRAEDGLTVSLQSPGSMFLFLTVYQTPLLPEELVERALATMREEYHELDSSPVSDSIADCPAIGCDLNFISLDLTNTCWIRAFAVGQRTVLIFAQTSDLELETSEPAFQAICASLELAENADD
jgi:hypothetical protein